jgi:GNAT superfamily N-acetyltransferase
MDGGVVIELVAADRTYNLRQRVLRPGLPEESTQFRGDDHPLVAHAAALTEGTDGDRDVVSVGTVFPDAPPWAPETMDAWRIRGMATAEGMRGCGIGRGVLDALIAHAESHGASLVWCHARDGAIDFYRRAGFVTTGEPFHDGIAPHQSMYLVIGPTGRSESSSHL